MNETTQKMSEPQFDYGLKLKPIVEGDHYVFEGYTKISAPVINPSGDWSAYLSYPESQINKYVDTKRCAIYGTDNAIETGIIFKGGGRVNYSERYISVVGNWNPEEGIDPHEVAELIRKTSGELDDQLLPFSDDIQTLDDYYKVPNITSLIPKGQNWWESWELGHEWVFNQGSPQEKHDKLADALTKGTVCVSVSAWYQDADGNYFKPPYITIDNHWVQLLNIEEDGRYKIFDSYDSYVKYLVPDYDFQVAKIYYLSPAEPKRTIMKLIIEKCKQVINLLLQQLVDEPMPITQPDEVLPPQVPPVVPLKPQSRINAWAIATRQEEGWFKGSRSWNNNNPGNIKWDDVISPLIGAHKKDANNFCIFQTADSGFNGLCTFLHMAASNKIKPYHDKTLKEFVQIYAQPPANHPYCENVARYIGCKVDDLIKTLL